MSTDLVNHQALKDLIREMLQEILGEIQSPVKLWLTMDEAVEESNVSEWEIRKRIKAGIIETHQPNPGKPPLRINRDSLLRSMLQSGARKEARR